MEEQPSSQDSNNKQHEGNSVAEPPPIQEQAPSDPIPNATQNEPHQPFDERTELSRADIIGHRLSLAEIILLIITGLCFLGEYWEIRNQSILMESQITTEASEGRLSDENTKNQLNLLRDQVDAIKDQSFVDQRPWIRVTWKGSLDGVPQNPTTQVGISNIGKTPARDVRAVFKLIVMKNKASISFLKHPDPSVDMKSWIRSLPPRGGVYFGYWGIQFSGELNLPIDVGYGPPGAKDPGPISETDYASLQAGDSYLALHGIVIYSDTFHIDHWTQFCTWTGLAAGHSFNAGKCSDYNDADTNTPADKTPHSLP